MAQRGQRTSPFSLFSFQDIITCVSGIFILITLMLVLQLAQRKQASPQVDASEIAAQLRAAIAAAEAEVTRLASMLESESSRVQAMAGISVESVRRELFDTREDIKLMEAELAELAVQERKVKKAEASSQADLFDCLQAKPVRSEMERNRRSLEDQVNSIKNSDQLIYNSTSPDGKTIWLAQLDTGVILVAASGIKQQPEEFRDRFATNASSRFGAWLLRRSPSQDYFFLLVRPGGTDEFESVRELLAARGFSVGFDVLGEGQKAVDPVHGAALP